MAQRAKAKKKTTRKSSPKKSAKQSSVKLPRVGQTVIWHAMPGDVEGKVVAILREDTSLNGRKIKASAQAPRIKLRSNASGKICVHKPENVRPAR